MADQSDIEREALRQEAIEHFREMRRIGGLAKELKKARDRHNEAGVAALLKIGATTFLDPVTGSPLVASRTAAETLEVDAQALYAELVAYYRGLLEEELADTIAEEIWRSTLKPPAVDTKEGGLYHKACERHDLETRTFGIPDEVTAKVASWKTAAAFVDFNPPKGEED